MSRPRDRSSGMGLLPRMEARPHKNGKTATYRYHPAGGKPVNLGTDREKALRWVLDQNGLSDDNGTVGWVWARWQESKRWKRLAGGTQADYALAWSQLEKVFGRLPFSAVTPPMVARYVHITRADSPRRADIERTVLSNLAKHAIMLGVADNNPTVGVEPHGSTPSTVMPQDLAVRAFTDWCVACGGQRVVLAAMVQFAARAGSRRAEFLRATWSQVDFDAGVVRLPRAKQRGREVFDAVGMSPGLRALLEALPREGPYLFPTRDGNPYDDRGFKSLWQRAMVDAIEQKVLRPDQRFNFHALRRYYTTHHRAETGELPDLHADKRVTARVYDATKVVARRAL